MQRVLKYILYVVYNTSRVINRRYELWMRRQNESAACWSVGDWTSPVLLVSVWSLV